MKRILFAAVFTFATTLSVRQVQAQDFPVKPIRIVVPFGAGGPTDILARVIAQKMSENWKKQVLVDNRPGGNTFIGAKLVAQSPADGYTLLMAIDSTMVMNQYLYSKLPYDPIRDFAAISMTAWSPNIIVVNAATGPKSIPELVQQARANPGKFNYGTATITTQLGFEMIKKAVKVEVTHVPYKGAADNVIGLLGGSVDVVLDGVTPYVPYVNNGKLRVLATTGTRPIAALPNTPRLSDMPGFAGFDVAVWLGLVAPAGTPVEIVNKLHREVARVLSLPDVKETLVAAGIDAEASSSPAEFTAFINREAARWSSVIKESGIRLD